MNSIEDSRAALPFEQQPRESNKAFAKFSLYLSLGPERSLELVSKKCAKSVPLLKRWSAKFDWPVRVSSLRGAFGRRGARGD
ncbi:MAG: hypothetical protein IH623_02275 [Verrucomicrobia bacterium]|nr:hypothetical protein [Verrucomicrobiota bacterium]